MMRNRRWMHMGHFSRVQVAYAASRVLLTAHCRGSGFLPFSVAHAPGAEGLRGTCRPSVLVRGREQVAWVVREREQAACVVRDFRREHICSWLSNPTSYVARVRTLGGRGKVSRRHLVRVLSSNLKSKESSSDASGCLVCVQSSMTPPRWGIGTPSACLRS